MTSDHLTSRQINSGYVVLGQHPLTDVSTGLSSKSAATSWATQQSNSKLWLPRCGKVGVHLIDATSGKTLRVVDDNVGSTSPVIAGTTLECVALTTTTGYNFFGGPWARSICSVWGSYGYNITIELYPTNDVIGDTTGRARIATGDVGGTRVASRTVHSRPVISDGLPHHILLTHEYNVTSSAIKLYVDGVNTETVTTTGVLAETAENTLTAGVDDYFTGFDGSVSHLCLTQGVLPLDEIKARANLVNKGTGSRFTDQGKYMVWDATNSTWVPMPKSYQTSAWKNLVEVDYYAPGATSITETVEVGQKFRYVEYADAGSFVFTALRQIENAQVLVVGAGGGGAGASSLYMAGGGGGGGSVIEQNSVTINAGTNVIVVGAGGAGGSAAGTAGGNSSALGYAAYGGGAGQNNANSAAASGGSGGCRGNYNAGTSTYAYKGGNGSATYQFSAGGGGGAGGAASDVSGVNGTNGGSGYTSTITGSPTRWGGGGGGGSTATAGTGGSSVGGNGGSGGAIGSNAAAGTGGGGGGASYTALNGNKNGGNGANGRVIIKYPIWD